MMPRMLTTLAAVRRLADVRKYGELSHMTMTTMARTRSRPSPWSRSMNSAAAGQSAHGRHPVVVPRVASGLAPRSGRPGEPASAGVIGGRPFETFLLLQDIPPDQLPWPCRPGAPSARPPEALTTDAPGDRTTSSFCRPGHVTSGGTRPTCSAAPSCWESPGRRYVCHLGHLLAVHLHHHDGKQHGPKRRGRSPSPLRSGSGTGTAD